MPRIDPLDLLNCLGVLLSTTGGIKGPGEVVRVARLMLRFSKKLVSKCIYIHVLKATPAELLDQFLNEQGAYFLLLKWLTEALQTRNTPLLAEMLELIQLLPMSDVRLKDEGISGLIRSCLPYNDFGQMMQSIAHEYSDQNCRNLAAQFWTRWFSSPNKPDEFTLAQEGILPDDMDLSIYAPDASSAQYGDPLSINMGEDVGMTMGNLSTLDMNSCAPYMENNDYYNLNHFEHVPMNNNMGHDNHQVYMDGTANYSNEPLQQQTQLQHQQVLNPGAVEVNNQLLSSSTTAEWPANSAMAMAAPIPIVPPAQEQPTITDETKPSEVAAAGLPVLKIKVKGGTYVVNSTNNQGTVGIKEEAKPLPAATGEQVVEPSKEKEKPKEKIKEKKKEKDKKPSSSGSSSSTSSKTKDDGSKPSDPKRREKERERSKSSSLSSSKDSKSSNSAKDRSKSGSSSSRDDASRKERPKVKGSPRSDSQSKEAKQAEKNRETLAAIKAMTPAVKLAKIPRKKVEDTSASSGDATVSTASSVTDALDKLTPRPKTVKTFNSKFRSTGLVDEPGKSPPVVNKKVGVASPSSALDKRSPSVKRSGSIDGLTPPADKKLKAVDDTAISAAVAAVMKKTASDIKPAVKLISPRPRPLLQDSSLFMDALEAGSKATTEPRKRKRSGLVKDGLAPGASDLPISVKTEPQTTPPVSQSGAPVSTTGETSPTPVKPMFNFYQDTLETDGATKEEEKSSDSADAKEIKEEDPESPSTDKILRVKTEVDGEEQNEDGNSRDSTKTDMADEAESPPQSESGKPKGVLVLHASQKRRPKKCVQWRAEEELEMHHYFELDETERVNVNKLLFGEMKQAEREREKQAFQMSKTMVEEPEVEENPWKGLQPIDLPEDRVIYGENSQERKIQTARESSTLQALYFKGQLLPDTPIEADPEVPLERTDSAPTIIPLDDVTGNPESVYDHRNLPWPEPKTTPYGGPSTHHPLQAPQHLQPQQQYGSVYRAPVAQAPMDPYYPDRGPAMHADPYGHDLPHHPGVPMHHHHPGGRGGPPGPRGGVGVVDGGGTWMAGDGSIYPDHDVSRYNDGPPQHPRDGPPHHHRDNFHHHREREPHHPRDRGGHGYNDMMGGGGPGPGYMGPPRGMGMDGPRPRFHGPPRGGGGRPGGPPSARGGPSNQPCWHFMRGFCRLENRCKFLHPNNYNGAPMP